MDIELSTYSCPFETEETRIQRFLYRLCELRKAHQKARTKFHRLWTNSEIRKTELGRHEKVAPMLF